MRAFRDDTADARRELGLQLKRRRTGAGLTQAELAKRAGVSDAWVSRVEAGLLWPSGERLARLVKALNGNLEDWAGWVADDHETESLISTAEDRIGHLIAEALNGVGQLPPDPKPDDHVMPLPEQITDLHDPVEVIDIMLALLASASEAGPYDHHDAGFQGPADGQSIVICRYTTEDILRILPMKGRKWDWYLRRALQSGWNVDHLRSHAAWLDEMQQEDIREAGGPLSLLTRIGFAGDYRLGTVRTAADRSSRFNYIDVPETGSLLFRPEGLGCYIPPRPEFAPLRRTLRREALELADSQTPIVTQFRSERPATWDVDVQESLLRIESQPGDRILVKNGFNVVLQPPRTRSKLLNDLVAHGRITEAERARLEVIHSQRRSLFLKHAQQSNVLDICPMSALRNFAELGRFQLDSIEEPPESSVDQEDRTLLLRTVADYLEEFPNYQLALVEERLPVTTRCFAKASDPPVVCIESSRGSGTYSATWAEIREATFCSSLMAYLRKWHVEHVKGGAVDARRRLLQLADADEGR